VVDRAMIRIPGDARRRPSRTNSKWGALFQTLPWLAYFRGRSATICLGQGQFVCLQWRCGRGGVSCAEEEVNAKPRVGLGHGLIRHLQGLGCIGNHSQAVGTGLALKRAVGAGEPGRDGAAIWRGFDGGTMVRAEGCDPCRGRNLAVPVTGGVALLNPRLMAGIPPGWLRAITSTRW